MSRRSDSKESDTMNTSTKLFLSTLAMASIGLLASPAALARDGEQASPSSDGAAVSTLTRAQVRAEVVRAQRAGELTYGEFGSARNDFLARSTVVAPRAPVLAEPTRATPVQVPVQVTAR